MVGPNNKAEGADANYCIDYSYYSKGLTLMGGLGRNMRNRPKCRKDKNINLWMSKESKEVLVKNRITPSNRVEERCIEISVGKKHGDRSCQNGEGEKK